MNFNQTVPKKKLMQSLIPRDKRKKSRKKLHTIMQKNLILPLSQQTVMINRKSPRVHQRNFLSMKRHSPKPTKRRKKFKKHRIIFLINGNFKRNEFMTKKSKNQRPNLFLKNRQKDNRRAADFSLQKNQSLS